MPIISFGVECADWRVALRKAMLASMASYEYRVTEAADGTFPVELWRSGEGGRCIYKTTGFQTRELAGLGLSLQRRSRWRFNLMTLLRRAAA